MQRLTEQSLKNSAAAYNAIFNERMLKGTDEHDMRRWKKLISKYKGGQLIDLGCLDSLICTMIKDPYLYYTGVDLAEGAIKNMDDSFEGTFRVKDICDTGYPNGLFDYAILGEVIEHLENPEKAIAEAMRILKPGGVLAISTPLEESREPGAVDGDRHLWSFSKLDLETMLMPYGPVELDTVGSLFSWKPPFYRYCWPSLIAFVWKK